MSLFRLLNERRDEWTSSLSGLDGLEAKPEIYNENIPAFKHNPVHLVVRKELRSDEAFLRDFTPFNNKKDAEYLNKMRLTEWLDANMPDTTLLGDTTAEAYHAQDVVDTELPPSPPSEQESDYYEGQQEDLEFFTDFKDEIIENTFEPGTAMYEMVERHNAVVRGSGIEAHTFKGRQMEAQAPQGGGAAAEQSRIDAERDRAAREDMIEEWKYAINPDTGKQFTKSELKDYIKTTLGKSRDIGLSGVNSYRGLFKYMIDKGITPPT